MISRKKTSKKSQKQNKKTSLKIYTLFFVLFSILATVLLIKSSTTGYQTAELKGDSSEEIHLLEINPSDNKIKVVGEGPACGLNAYRVKSELGYWTENYCGGSKFDPEKGGSTIAEILKDFSKQLLIEKYPSIQCPEECPIKKFQNFEFPQGHEGPSLRVASDKQMLLDLTYCVPGAFFGSTIFGQATTWFYCLKKESKKEPKEDIKKETQKEPEQPKEELQVEEPETPQEQPQEGTENQPPQYPESPPSQYPESSSGGGGGGYEGGGGGGGPSAEELCSQKGGVFDLGKCFKCSEGTVYKQGAGKCGCESGYELIGKECKPVCEAPNFRDASRECVSCQQFCESQGLTSEKIDHSSYILDYLNSYGVCKSSAQIKGGKQLKVPKFNCECFDSNPPEINFGPDVVCQPTPCGPVPCNQEKSCPQGAGTLTITCNWGGWKSQGGRFAPVIQGMSKIG